MAALLKPHARPGVRPFLALPPALRQSIYQQQNPHGARHFSLSAVTSSLDVASVVSLGPAMAMEGLHAIGLPWWAVFPASALLIRSLLVYPFFQKPMRKTQIERISVQPLSDAKLGAFRASLRSKHLTRTSITTKMFWQRFLINRNLGRHIFAQPMVPLKRVSSFFTLVAVSDSIRRLCGHREGLLTLLLGGSVNSGANTKTPADTKAAGHESAQDAALQQPLVSEVEEGWANDGDMLAANTTTTDAIIAELQNPSARPNIATDSPWFEPGLLTDGFSWCPDLTAGDPTLVLPVLFSASFFANIYYSPRVDRAGSGKATNMQRIGMTIALLSFFPALQMPAALLLYYISNIWIAALQGRWLRYTMPSHPVPLACKRPVRMQPMKEMKDEFTDLGSRQMRGR